MRRCRHNRSKPVSRKLLTSFIFLFFGLINNLFCGLSEDNGPEICSLRYDDCETNENTNPEICSLIDGCEELKQACAEYGLNTVEGCGLNG
jgi:hypothetical protein